MKNQSFWNRLGFAVAGIHRAWQTESSFKAQTVAAGAAVLVLVLGRGEPIWWALFALTSGAVLTAEMVNTSLETLMDLVHPERHESIRVAKDCAAGAVLVASAAAVAVFVAFLMEKFKPLLF